MGVLRFLLAISVVVAHSGAIFGFHFVDGQTAVQAFYIISGFYMSLVLNEKYVGINNSYKLFIVNRFLRLYPIYWVVLLLTLVYSLTDPLNTDRIEYAAFSYYATCFNEVSLSSFLVLGLTNLLLLGQDIVMFLGINSSTGNLMFTENFRQSNPELYHFLFVPQAWTIGIEIAFYLIAPLFLRKKLNVILLLLALSLLIRLVLYVNGLDYDPWTYRFFPAELTFFLLGALSYQLYTRIRAFSLPPLLLKAIWAGLIAFSILYSFLPLPAKHSLYLLVFFTALPFVFVLTKNYKNDAYIGELSYPIYISHLLVLSVITALRIPVVGGIGLSLTSATILFSILLNELIAKRIEKVRQKRVRPTRF